MNEIRTKWKCNPTFSFWGRGLLWKGDSYKRDRWEGKEVNEWTDRKRSGVEDVETRHPKHWVEDSRRNPEKNKTVR